MDDQRRRFLKIAGLSVLGLGLGPASKAIGGPEGSEVLVSPEAKIGKRWAMVVDHKKCLKAKNGCKDCVAACNVAHNVPEFDNPKDAVKWIWLEPYDHAFPGEESKYGEAYFHDTMKGLPLPVLCNHCDNPPCVRVCPVKATFKRDDGIVMMDYHRCIGCRFCMAACPYGARSLNWRDPRGQRADGTPFIKSYNPEYPTRMRGVVEKCTFCFELLAKGKNPACVDACKEKGLVFGDLEDPNSPVRELLAKNPSVRRKAHLGTQPQVYYIL
jgi:Fe-S-cluster-containing dehydrogenase component